MFIAKNGDLIILAKDTREELEQALQLMVYTSIEETDINYQLYNGKYLTEEEKQEQERERILELRMTPLDFLKAIEQYGITYDMVKQFMEENPLIERELRFCQFVYRKHPMLNNLEPYGITSEVLDTIFRKANGEDV